MDYAELHCHSYYSFHDGASSLEELMLRAKELGYRALAVTDHNNLCAAMRFAQLSRSLEFKGITGAELTLKGGGHLTLLAENRTGYSNLCRLITSAYAAGRENPELDPAQLPVHAGGLICLSGCPEGELSRLVTSSRAPEAGKLVRQYRDWFGPQNYYIELQHNLVPGDAARNRILIDLARENGLKVVATGNVHYHVRERHQLARLPGGGPALQEPGRDAPGTPGKFGILPAAYRRTGRTVCRMPGGPGQYHGDRRTLYFRPGRRPAVILSRPTLPRKGSRRKATWKSCVTKLPSGAMVRSRRLCGRRLEQEFNLIRKYNLAGFLLMYHEVIKLGREVMIEQGLCEADLPLEENPPGRGRGSSVALLAGYLIGLSHIDPLKYSLSLERFLPADTMNNVPDIDLDFPRSIREELILKTHGKWGWEHAVLTGTICTYLVKGAVRDLGKALGLPQTEVDQLAKFVDWGSAKNLEKQMQKSPHFKDKAGDRVWRDLVRLSAELDGFPKYLGQHPGGMILSSLPLTDIVPVQPGAIDGRYVCQWDKDSIDDAGFVKIDFLALGALSQLQEAVELIRRRTGKRVDLSRIDFEDAAVYDMLCKGDTIGIFQVESAAQMQTITRLHPRNLLDMAHEVGAVRPGVGVNHGVQEYLARRSKKKPVTYDHPLEQRALERTLGIILFQDQVNQVAIDVAGFAPSEADRLRRAFGRRHNERTDRAVPPAVPGRGRRAGGQRNRGGSYFQEVQRPVHVPGVACLCLRCDGVPGVLVEVLLSPGVLCGYFQPAADGFL